MLRIVAGPPFAGKTQWVQEQIDKREKAGERGLLLIDFTALYLGMFPGEADKVRLQGSVGVPLTQYMRETLLQQAQDRELDGFVTVAKPATAERLRERLVQETITVVDTPETVVRERMEKHMRQMYAIRGNQRKKDAIRGECEGAVDGWFNDYVEQEWHRKTSGKPSVTRPPKPAAPDNRTPGQRRRANVVGRLRGHGVTIKPDAKTADLEDLADRLDSQAAPKGRRR